MRIAKIQHVVVETFIPLPQGEGCFWSDGEFAEWLSDNQELTDEGQDVNAGRGESDERWLDYDRLAGDFDFVAVYTSRPRPTERVESLARYFLEGPFAGECYGVKSPDAFEGWGQLFIISADSTKSRHDDWTDSIDELWPQLREGSPVRKTDRSGPGTKGTRAVEGLHCDLWIAFR